MLGLEYIKDNELFWEIVTNYLNNRIFDPDRDLPNVLNSKTAWQNEGEFLSDIVRVRHEGSFQRAFMSSPAAVEGFSIFFSGLLNFADQIADAEEALEFMTRMTERIDFDFPSLYSAFAHSEQTRETTKRRVEDLVEKSQIFIGRVASHPCTNAGLLTLSSLFINPENRLQFQQYILMNLASQLSFDELVDLAFKPNATKTPAIWGVLEKRIEESSQKGFQLERLLDHGTRMVLEREFELAGGLNVIDAVMEKGIDDPESLLRAALNTVHSERPLLAYGLKKWWERFGKIVLQDLEIPGLLISEKAMEDWLTDSLAEAANGEEGETLNPYLEDLNLRTLLNVLYDSGPFTRAFLVRKALMNSEYGILRSTSSAKRVMKPFLEEHIDLEPATKQEVAKVLEAIIDSSTSSELCFIGLPGLASRVFIKPPSESDLEEALEESGLLSTISEHLADSYNVSSLKDADKDWARDYDFFLPERFANLHELVIERLRNLVFGNIRGKKEVFKALPLRAETAIVQSLPVQQEELRRQNKLSAPEILKEIGRREGAPGPRFLQLYFQSFPMPPEKKAELIDVHDDIPGQTKLVAYMTIREMAPGLIRAGDTLGPLRGWGSLVTVYSLTREGDEDRPLVVKVLNPNAEARVEETMGRARRWVNKLLENEPENQVYRHIHQYILNELEAWLLSDIRDERFVELDKIFRNRWHDYKIGKKYSIGIPRSYDVKDFIDIELLHDTENPNIYVKVEEEIQGKNLTQFSPAAQTDFDRGTLSLSDAKEIMTLIVSNYIEQVLTGLVHSNPQLGNFRLRSDGKVFIIDRNYFLEFNDREKKLFKTLIRGAVFGGDTKRRLLDYFFSDPENSRVDEQDKLRIYGMLQNYKNEVSLNGLSRLLAELKQNGLKIPLRFSLLAINFNALDSMCRDLGLRGLADAISSRKILPKITPGLS
ncbi:MAG: hypothetical protein GYA55_00670 [SAR324 cluster bacterium]|uniref:ABC1 atypical kinase-like domain-containing protein n=1 Tax=SAR324 cluster bacterium TaxID=2024889 RepID=A0A7X9FP06_9DELT|nr:hypothetical protein [SAR324 cluster bacterium]